MHRSAKKKIFVHRRDDAGRRGPEEQRFDGMPYFHTEIDRVLVHVQVDVPVHDVLAVVRGRG